ncbi:MAG TPA: hypothetical protein DCG47_07585 [Spirochaetaceae bacterium]|jgi:two-component sensor histidine kinase|nr:hypothetical protein [Spirochaetaceae bacterium]
MQRRLVLALCLLASLAPLHAQTVPKNVLILHSYQHDLDWTRLIHAGMVMELESVGNPPVLIKTEYMDTKRAWNEELARCFADYLILRYSEARIDLVLVSDNDAFDFMLMYGPSIFGDAAFVFTGVNDFDPASIAGIRGRVTGVVEHIDYHSTINAIHMMFPELRELWVLADASTSGLKTLKEFLEAAEEIRCPLEISSFTDAPFSEIVAESEGLSDTSAVMLLSYARDKAGLVWSMRDIGSQLSAAAKGPVFGLWDFYMGHGIVGGALTSGLAQGRAAGAMALRVLKGESPATIEVDDVRATPLSLDWRQLKRFGVPMSRVPDGAVILYKPLGLYERDPRAFLAISVLIAAVLLLGASLALTRIAYSRLRASELRLAGSLKEKESLLKEVHHRVKNNFQVIASLLSLQADGFEDESTKKALLESENRIRSMALVHAEIYEESDLAAIDLGSYTRALASHLISTYADTAPRAVFELQGERALLELERAIPLGLLLNELMSNSLKYACDETGRCRMSIHIATDRDGGFVLRYADDGPGLPRTLKLEKPDTLGLQLMAVLASQLGAGLSRDEEDAAAFIIKLKEAKA